MQLLRRGSEGDAVRRWQEFLLGQDLDAGPVDGVFGPKTETATRTFQRKRRVKVDGFVGPKTYAAALQVGFDLGFTDPQGGSAGVDWPPKPVFAPLISNTERAEVFGRFRFERTSGDDIRILDDWQKHNIVKVTIPQLRSVGAAPASGGIWVHKRVADQTRALFDAWENDGVAKLLLTWHGTFAPRFVRGSSGTLSSHAWGTAFDVNLQWNRLGVVPARLGQKGAVRELVPLANQFGFYWGGHFRRRDGMHFEAARPFG